MPITYLRPICEYLNISADYIIGLINEPKSLKNEKQLTNIK